MMIIFGQLGFVVSDWLKKVHRFKISDALEIFHKSTTSSDTKIISINFFLNEFEKFFF